MNNLSFGEVTKVENNHAASKESTSYFNSV